MGEVCAGRRLIQRGKAPRRLGTVRRKAALLSAAAALSLIMSLVVATSVWPTARHVLGAGQPHLSARASLPTPTTEPTADPAQWIADQATTAPNPDFRSAALGFGAVDPVFQSYYALYGGATGLGAPLTPGFSTTAGWIQFFANAALLAPAVSSASPSATSTPASPGNVSLRMARDGIYDSATNIIQLPLLRSLLTAGSLLPIGGPDSSMTYEDLRRAASPSAEVSESATEDAAQSVFIAEGQLHGHATGHLIPEAIWDFVTRDDLSPDGWQVDVGQPLTEPLRLTAVRSDGTHHLLLQAFWQRAVLLDQDDLDANGQPAVQFLGAGLDFARTFGLPAATVPAGRDAWITAPTAILGAPGSGAALLHVAQNWRVTLTGQTTWLAGHLWYQVNDDTRSASRSGWVDAGLLTEAAPPAGASGAASAGIDALSPDLAAYLAGQGGNVGVAVYDESRNVYYTGNADSGFIMGSSNKIPIMLTYLAMVEGAGRSLTGDEAALMTAMIENSDNGAAQSLYETLGYDPTIASYLQSLGISGYAADPNGWGWATFPPRAMVRLLTLLHDGRILNSGDRAFALSLLANVEADQRFGGGDTAPSGASVAMKDGWVVGPDGLWDANSSGIVSVGGETYIISVYTRGQASLDSNYAILQHVCGTVAALLA